MAQNTFNLICNNYKSKIIFLNKNYLTTCTSTRCLFCSVVVTRIIMSTLQGHPMHRLSDRFHFKSQIVPEGINFTNTFVQRADVPKHSSILRTRCHSISLTNLRPNLLVNKLHSMYANLLHSMLYARGFKLSYMRGPHFDKKKSSRAHKE